MTKKDYIRRVSICVGDGPQGHFKDWRRDSLSLVPCGLCMAEKGHNFKSSRGLKQVLSLTV